VTRLPTWAKSPACAAFPGPRYSLDHPYFHPLPRVSSPVSSLFLRLSLSEFATLSVALGSSSFPERRAPPTPFLPYLPNLCGYGDTADQFRNFPASCSPSSPFFHLLLSGKHAFLVHPQELQPAFFWPSTTCFSCPTLTPSTLPSSRVFFTIPFDTLGGTFVEP